MRVTESSIYRSFLANIENLNEGMAQVNQQLGSGKKLSNLSDSPSGSAELLNIRTELSDIDQYTQNADSSNFFLGVTDSALNSLYNVVTSIFTTGSQAASDLNGASGRANLAQEIRSLRDQVLSLANTEAGGRYVFAGSRVSEPAFTISGDTVTYQGDSETNTVVVNDGLQVRQSVAGSSVFSPVFARINDLLNAIDSGDQAGIQNALNQFSSTMETIGQVRAQVGVDLSKLQSAKTEQSTRKTILSTQQSTLQDADMAQAATQLNQIQTALQAAMTAQSITQQKNLFDFLG